MCNTTKEIGKTLLITHQGNSQVKDNKIDLLLQQYEQFVISKDESIDSAFARFNTIINSLKALDEGYYSKNYVRKFLRALHFKWRVKVTTIEELKDLTSLSLDKLTGNLKAKKESSDEESLTSRSEDEEYAIAVRDFNKFFKRKGSGTDSGEEDNAKSKNETCLIAQTSSEICLGIDLEPDEWIKDSGCTKYIQLRRLGHANMRIIQSLASKELVRNLPKLKFDQQFCDACKIGKLAHASHKAKNMVSTTRCLELFHMDLFSSSVVQSYGGNLYTLVIVDDYSRTDHGREFDMKCNLENFVMPMVLHITSRLHTLHNQMAW
ncbi:retrovirus-related pol polyprotein from transposon TNT 1-94 [Tanacetum coccineum]